MPAAVAATFVSLADLPRRHRAVVRVSLAALAFTIVTTVSLQDPIQAGPANAAKAPAALLPQNVGIGVRTDSPVLLTFDEPMDPASVEAGLQLHPAQGFRVVWSDDLRSAGLHAERRWRTDERYVVVVDTSARDLDGERMGGPRRFSFTTETAPTVSDFQVRLASRDLPREDVSAATLAVETAESERGDAAATSPPREMDPATTAEDVSASSAITVSFSAPMDRADVEERFAITPRVKGELSWQRGALVFTPTERLEPGGRYTISLVGAHDATGNAVGGKTNFSFYVRPGAQLIKVRPGIGERNVETDSVEMWFSHPMDVDATNRAFGVVDIAAETAVAGTLTWNEAGTQLTFSPADPFLPGRAYEVRIGKRSRDTDGNRLARDWQFVTAGAPAPELSAPTTRAAPVIPPPAPSSDLAVYALNQVNAARAAYGFAPLTLDASISAVAYAHAYDQAVNGYFSHTSLDGRTRDDRLRAGGVSYSWSGENQCYLVGRSLQGTLDWCHAQFMAEPYPGQFNHIANILSPNARRMGVGIGSVGGRVVITWNFTN